MKLLYSKSTNGFYDSKINRDIPTDAVEITKEQHQDLLEKQNQGMKITNDDNGYPIAINVELEPADIVIISKNKKNLLLSIATSKINILQDAVDLDMVTNDESFQLKEWKKYRVLLNRVDINNVNVVFPDEPN